MCICVCVCVWTSVLKQKNGVASLPSIRRFTHSRKRFGVDSCFQNSTRWHICKALPPRFRSLRSTSRRLKSNELVISGGGQETKTSAGRATVFQHRHKYVHLQCLPPRNRREAGKQKERRSNPLRLLRLFESCGLWTLSESDFAPTLTSTRLLKRYNDSFRCPSWRWIILVTTM